MSRLDGYDWRAAEANFNSSLPQYRTTITTPSTPSKTTLSNSETLRIHFVHKQSQHSNAVPLLLCVSWSSCWISSARNTDFVLSHYSTPGPRHSSKSSELLTRSRILNHFLVSAKAYNRLSMSSLPAYPASVSVTQACPKILDSAEQQRCSID